jgi:hypothetical protein
MKSMVIICRIRDFIIGVAETFYLTRLHIFEQVI